MKPSSLGAQFNQFFRSWTDLQDGDALIVPSDEVKAEKRAAEAAANQGAVNAVLVAAEAEASLGARVIAVVRVKKSRNA